MRTIVWQMLVRLGALAEEEETITSLGRHLAAFPIAPRYAKMLVLGHQVCLVLARPPVHARLAFSLFFMSCSSAMSCGQPANVLGQCCKGESKSAGSIKHDFVILARGLPGLYAAYSALTAAVWRTGWLPALRAVYRRCAERGESHRL